MRQCQHRSDGVASSLAHASWVVSKILLLPGMQQGWSYSARHREVPALVRKGRKEPPVIAACVDSKAQEQGLCCAF